MNIGIDISGGDFAPDATVSGALLALQELPQGCSLTLIGDSETIHHSLTQKKVSPNNFTIVHAPEHIGMGEHPVKAYSQKPNSSISVGFKLLSEGKIDAFASAGNSGAMLVGCMYTIKTVPGVTRPCITSILPRENGGVGLILDVGINSDCKPDVLYQFGTLGSLYAEHVYKIKKPKVGLLNIGEEPEKGNLIAQAAHNLMKEGKDFNFIGNVEGRDLFSENVDVIVCDGFTGNVVLKEAEAFYSLVCKRKIKDDYFARFNYEIYGGTPVLGVNGAVIIGHGISSALAIKNMLLLALEVAQANLADKIKQAFQ